MRVRTFTLLIGCGSCRRKITLRQSNCERVDLWNRFKLERLGINPEDLTGIIVGPGLVVDLFTDGHYNHLAKTIENPRNKRGVRFDIGCYGDHPIRKGMIRSLKVWEYNKYHQLSRLVRYCNTHNDCASNEMCLCPEGQNLKEWCPFSRKRCLNKALYFHNAKRTIWNPDEIDYDCVVDLLGRINVERPLYGHAKNVLHICKKWPRHCVENFGPMSRTNSNLFGLLVFVVIVCVMVYLYRQQ